MPIDLRSDTVTKPSPQMRRAMAEAEVGDDVFREDPTVNRLQNRAAEIFEREAAIFVPSGSMGNLLAIWSHTQPGQEVICETDSHIYNYEMGSMAAIAGVIPRSVKGANGILEWSNILPEIHPKLDYRSQTGLVALENTHNMAGGTVYPVETMREIIGQSHRIGIPVHLDGARVFNAAVASNKSVGEITRGFDSVNFCLSKGLGAPVGSVLVGTREIIERARRYRKMLGGGMRQAGILAAAGLIALEESPSRLHEDHANACHLAEALASMRGIQIEPAKVVTNIVIFDVAGTGMDAPAFLDRLTAAGVLAVHVGQTRIRFVTHCDVSRPDIEKAIEAISQLVAK